MDYELTTEQQAWKDEFETFFRKEMKNAPPVYDGPSPVEARFSSDEAWEFHRQMQRKLGERGWLSMAWPEDFGGRNASVIEQLLFNEMHAYFRAPGKDAGVNLLAPTLMLYGTEEQKKRLLPPIALGEVNYSQGWSEPDAGSDLAALRTTALKSDEHYVINGQKVWTTGAHRNSHIFVLARTDPEQKRSRGLSIFNVSMDTPGIEVRPIHYMDGKHMYNEVYFNEVKVHKDELIGEENEGWRATRATMNFERSGMEYFVIAKRRMHELLDYIKTAKRGNKPLYSIPSVGQKMTKLYIDVERGIALAQQAAWKQEKGDAISSAHLASGSKVQGTELFQRIAVFGTEIMGQHGRLAASHWAPLNGVLVDIYQWCMGGTISMGSNEIQRNIIAWIGLGLPRYK